MDGIKRNVPKKQLVCVCNSCGIIIKLKYANKGNRVVVSGINPTISSYNNEKEMFNNVLTWGCGLCQHNLFDNIIRCKEVNCDKCEIRYACFTEK